jgi:hypothetical protein
VSGGGLIGERVMVNERQTEHGRTRLAR